MASQLWGVAKDAFLSSPGKWIPKAYSNAKTRSGVGTGTSKGNIVKNIFTPNRAMAANVLSAPQNFVNSYYGATNVLGNINGTIYYNAQRPDGGWDYFKGSGDPTKDFKISQTDAAREINLADTAETTQPLPTGDSDSSSGGGTQTPSFSQYFNGVLYTDPTAYTNAVNDTILTNYKAQEKKISDLYASGIIGLDEKLQMGRDNLASLKKSRDNSMKSIQGYFNRISPDAVQSEQNTLQNNVETDYNTQTGKIGNLFDGKKASEIAAMDLTPWMNDISTTGQIARAAQGLNTQKADQIAANDQWKMSATDQTANNLMDVKNNVATPSAGDIVSEYMNNLQGFGSGVTNDGGAAFVSTKKVPEDIDYWNQ